MVEIMQHRNVIVDGPDANVSFTSGASEEVRVAISDQSDSKKQNACRNIHILYIVIGILSLFLAVSVSVNIAQAVTKQTQTATFPSDGCLHGWIKNGHWCYLFSDDQKSLRFSSSNCSSYDASLVTLDSEQEWAFVKKMGQHGEYWIDFQRETVEQPWKWRNGSLVTHIKIGGVGFCAYLNYDGVSSTTCDNIRHWICRKSSDA